MPTCIKCGKEFDTAGNTCLDCIDAAWVISDTLAKTAQDAVIINRKENVAFAYAKHLTPCQAAETDVEHENFVVLNVVHDVNGVLYPNWNTRLTEHRADLHRKMERFRIQDGAALRVGAKLMIKEVEALTPEDRARYVKQGSSVAKAPRGIKVVTKAYTSLIEKQIAGLLKFGIAEDSEMIQTLRKMQK